MGESKVAMIEHKVSGWNAVKAVFEKRPHLIKHCYFTPDWRKETGELCRYLAKEKRSYAEKSWHDLSKMVGHSEHSGIVAFVLPTLPSKYTPKLLQEWQKASESILLVNQCRDARHLGKLVHLADFYGIQNILLRKPIDEFVGDNRVALEADGSLENVKLYSLDTFGPLIKPLSQHFTPIAVHCDGARNIQHFKKPIQVPGRPNAIIVGLGETKDDTKLASQCEFNIKAVPGAEAKLRSEFETALILSWLSQAKSTAGKAGGFREKMKQKKEKSTAPTKEHPKKG